MGLLQLSRPEPAMAVPLCYELAFGGPNLVRHERLLQACVDGEVGAHLSPVQRERAARALAALPDAYPPNPIGCGHHPAAIAEAESVLTELGLSGPSESHAIDGRRGPQIEAFQRPYDAQHDYPVVGVGPVGRWWSPRVALAGTHNEQWKQTQWPKSPLDHNYRYWNCAPEDQQIDYPQGGEEVVLANLASAALHSGPYRFHLPRQDLQLLVRLHVGVVMFAPMHIDTVVMNHGAGTLSIVRRAVVSAKTEVRQLELGTWPAGTGLQLDESMRQVAQARAASRSSHGRLIRKRIGSHTEQHYRYDHQHRLTQVAVVRAGKDGHQLRLRAGQLRTAGTPGCRWSKNRARRAGQHPRCAATGHIKNHSC